MSDAMNNTSSDPRVGWVQEPDGRGTMSLLWSCVATLIISTWTVQHLDVVWPNYRGWQTQRIRRIKCTTFALLMPEYTSAIAIEQYIEASKSKKLFSSLGLKSWTITHGFFATMNGFRILCPNGKIMALRMRELHWLMQESLVEDIPQTDSRHDNLSISTETLSEELINRHSKSDDIAKAISCIQCGWFLVQVIARTAEGLKTSPLEVMTIAFVSLCFISYAFWWKKPLDLELQQTLRVSKDKEEWWDRMCEELHVAPNRSEELERHWKGVGDLHLHAQTQLHAYFTFILGAAFGALHCLAWAVEFPSYVEMQMWRVCSLICTIWPLYMLVTTEPFVRRMSILWKPLRHLEHADKSSKLWSLGYIWSTAFLIARLYLIVEAFISLRSLPKDVYETPNWPNNVPHI